MEIKDRIRKIMETQHMTQQVFADFLQQSPATLSSIFNGRTRPTLNIVDAIKVKIPNISIEWLLYGIGEMYTTPSEASESVNVASPSGSEPLSLFDPISSGEHQMSPQKAISPSNKPVYQEGLREEVKIAEKLPRKVTEIRVYYDDQTSETFIPAKK